MSIKFPRLSPVESLEFVAKLQRDFLVDAETVLGKRVTKQRIDAPTFAAPGTLPVIQFNGSGDAVSATLSSNAANYWEALTYELGHEVVHLLDVREGSASWLEEGIAVHFSIRSMCRCRQKPYYTDDPVYSQAYRLVNGLPEGPIQFGRKVRAALGSLTGPTTAQLLTMSSKIDARVASRLLDLMPRRP
jgi:hypothetical protein